MALWNPHPGPLPEGEGVTDEETIVTLTHRLATLLVGTTCFDGRDPQRERV